MPKVKRKPVDKYLVILLAILVVVGFIIFSSASLGLFAKNSAQFSNVTFTQTLFGLLGGTLCCIALSKTDYKIFRNWAWLILIGSILVTLLVFIPNLGMSHGGALRWIKIGSFTFQPSELLKMGVVIFLAAWFSAKKGSAETFKKGTLPLLLVLAVAGIVFLIQPDTDNFLVTVFASLAIYFTAGGSKKHVFIMAIIGIILMAVLSYQRPYIKERFLIFFNPDQKALSSGYQAKQSLIAVGSGGLMGRGYGQSLQKFTHLPEPIGDSIFAVAAEEFGFVGASSLILLFVLFSMRCLKISANTEDTFGRLLIVGIVILLISQAFLNIGAMLGVLPLTGITLPFVSHGGSSLLVVLAEMGIVLSISRKRI